MAIHSRHIECEIWGPTSCILSNFKRGVIAPLCFNNRLDCNQIYWNQNDSAMTSIHRCHSSKIWHRLQAVFSQHVMGMERDSEKFTQTGMIVVLGITTSKWILYTFLMVGFGTLLAYFAIHIWKWPGWGKLDFIQFYTHTHTHTLIRHSRSRWYLSGVRLSINCLFNSLFGPSSSKYQSSGLASPCEGNPHVSSVFP